MWVSGPGLSDYLTVGRWNPSIALSHWGLIVISLIPACLIPTEIEMTEGSPLRIFKGSKKEFRGLEVALINSLVCIHVI